jgi:hypothetical protein
VKIAWRNWPDGHWEACVADESGRHLCSAEDLNELADCLEQICASEELENQRVPNRLFAALQDDEGKSSAADEPGAGCPQ